MKPLANIFLLTAMACLLSACSEPTVYDCYVHASQKDLLGRFGFTLDMKDSLSVYDIDLYSRLDCSRQEFRRMSDLEIKVRLISPSGVFYEEKFNVPKSSFIRSSAFFKEYSIPYRADLVPVEYGDWKMFIKSSSERFISGWGLRIVRHEPASEGKNQR